LGDDYLDDQKGACFDCLKASQLDAPKKEFTRFGASVK
jgi:hypothetical protein